jgi:hypothetical protein
MGTYAVNVYGWLMCMPTVPHRTIESKTNMQYIFKTLYNRTNHVNVKYHKSPVLNCHSEDKHSIRIGILIPSTTKYINMCSIVFIVRFIFSLKLSASLDFHFWIALWYSLTFSYRRLTFFPNCICTPTFSARHNNLASVVWNTSLMLFHFITVTAKIQWRRGKCILIDPWGSLFVPFSIYCPSSGQCIICPSIYGLQLPFDIFLLLHMYDLLYL